MKNHRKKVVNSAVIHYLPPSDTKLIHHYRKSKSLFNLFNREIYFKCSYFTEQGKQVLLPLLFIESLFIESPGTAIVGDAVTLIKWCIIEI